MMTMMIMVMMMVVVMMVMMMTMMMLILFKGTTWRQSVTDKLSTVSKRHRPLGRGKRLARLRRFR